MHFLYLPQCVCVCVFLHLQELCVDLELGNRPALLGGSLSALLDASEQVVDGAGNDTQLVLSDVDIEAGSHGVRLPRPCLDVGEKTESSIMSALIMSVRNVVSCFFQHINC